MTDEVRRPLRARLRGFTRDGLTLVIEPEVPAWAVVNADGLKVLMHTVDGLPITEAITALGMTPDERTRCERFAEDLRKSHFFEEPIDPRGAPGWWEKRRLTRLHLHLTARCNLRCTYCYNESGSSNSRQLDAKAIDHVTRWLDELSDDTPVVSLTGGEPTLHPGIWDVAESVKRVRPNARLALLTNGTRIVTKTVAARVAATFDEVRVSIDGASAATHGRTRGAASFARALRSIQLLKDSGASVKGAMTVDSHNQAEYAAVVAMLGIPVMFTPRMPIGRASADLTEMISAAEFVEMQCALPDWWRATATNVIPGQRNVSCSAGVTNLSIAADGEIFPCQMLHYPEYSLGNVTLSEPRAVFFGERLRRYVDEAHVDNIRQCSECSLKYVCGGGCRANARWATGTTVAPDAWCLYIREITLRALHELSARAAKRADPPPVPEETSLGVVHETEPAGDGAG